MQNFITIPKPCNEKWHAMTPTEQGRFCTSCDKVVTDFSAMSNDEILSFLKNKKHEKQEVCGKIRTESLTPAFTISNKLKHFLYAFALTYLPFLGFAQTNIDTQAFDKNNKVEPIRLTDTLHPSSRAVVITVQAGISGKLRNLDGQPIANATVIAYKKDSITHTTVSDSDGRYTLSPMAPGSYQLTFACEGYKTTILRNAEVKKGYEWPLTTIMYIYHPKEVATHDTREAPINHGPYGEPCMMGSVSVISDWNTSGPRFPGNNLLQLIDYEFNIR